MPPLSKLHITWVKSAIGYSQRQKATVRALGLHHLHQTVEQDDTPTMRGMLHAVRHLVSVIEGAGAAENGGSPKASHTPSFVVRKLPETAPAAVAEVQAADPAT
ncbi:MAG: 50S ribosomal protein L30, partial [Chloroflexota bacterium]